MPRCGVIRILTLNISLSLETTDRDRRSTAAGGVHRPSMSWSIDGGDGLRRSGQRTGGRRTDAFCSFDLSVWPSIAIPSQRTADGRTTDR